MKEQFVYNRCLVEPEATLDSQLRSFESSCCVSSVACHSAKMSNCNGQRCLDTGEWLLRSNYCVAECRGDVEGTVQ